MNDNTSNNIPLGGQWEALYNELKPLLDKQASPVLNAQREAAMEAFQRLGLPTRQQERYRYTDVVKAFAPNYGFTLAKPQIKDVPYVYDINDAPVDVTPYYNKIIDSAVNRDGEAMESIRSLKGEYYEDPLTALNTALVKDAIVIYVPKGEKVQKPIRIENILSGQQDTIAVRRVLIILEESAEATVFLVDNVRDDQQFLNLQVIEAVCKDNSHLEMYEMEETSEKCNRFSNLYIKTGRDSVVHHFNVTLNNGVTRNGIDVYLQGKNSEVTLNGAVIADGEQHVDVNTMIDHQVAQCQSNELYKFVVDDKAVGAFAGKIMVREGADQTASQETNNNVCASDEARMFTQPMLEIYADDVKCAHGSTVGVMDDAAIFYMQQRGIPYETAKTLLKYAFISQVIDTMKWDSFRDRLHILVDKRLSKEEKCGQCKICK